MDTKRKPDHRASTPPGEMLCGHGLTDLPVTRRTENLASVLMNERRFENIRFDVNNEARIMMEQLLKMRTMAVFNTPNIRKLPPHLNKGKVAELAEHANQILKNEGKVLHSNFNHELNTIAQEIFATDPSRQELQKSIVDCIERNKQALPL